MIALATFLLVGGCRIQDTAVKLDGTACQALGGTSGEKLKVMDGDTFRLQETNGTTVVVRLDQIDAPEKGQPWSKRSGQLLSDLLGVGELCVIGVKRDQYGRLLGEVRANGLIVNYEMVSQGAAWAYRQYLHDDKLLELEANARANKRGLWSMPPTQTIPPWEYRHPGTVSTKSAGTAQSLFDPSERSHFPLECSAKPICRQMISCEEAKMWLNKCGGAGIDGDGDGIPCERICGHG